MLETAPIDLVLARFEDIVDRGLRSLIAEDTPVEKRSLGISINRSAPERAIASVHDHLPRDGLAAQLEVPFERVAWFYKVAVRWGPTRPACTRPSQRQAFIRTGGNSSR